MGRGRKDALDATRQHRVDKRADGASTSKRSRSKKKRNEFEPETSFILRVPSEIADDVRKIAADTDGGGGKLEFEWEKAVKRGGKEELRRAKVFVNEQPYDGTLSDLPCVVESFKSSDKKTFYKATDVHQILVLKKAPPHDSMPPPASPERQTRASYQWPHGLTPPMKNARKSRFRRTLKRFDAELNEIEKELRRLLAEDCDAVRTRWELVTAEDSNKPGTPKTPTTNAATRAEPSMPAGSVEQHAKLPVADSSVVPSLSPTTTTADTAADRPEAATTSGGDVGAAKWEEELFGELLSDSDDEETL